MYLLQIELLIYILSQMNENVDIFQFYGFIRNTPKITITPSDNCVNKDLHM
jgi:hypothetical protein